VPTRSTLDPPTEAIRRVALRLAVVTTAALVAATVLPQSDVDIYHRYAQELLHGQAGTRLPVEYPALSAAVFAAPLVLPIGYKLGFALLMAMTFGALVLAGRALHAGPGWLDRLTSYLGLGTVAVLFARYDLLPSLAILVAALQARRHHWSSAWIACLVGAALKLFPLVLLPGFVLAEWREKHRFPWRRLILTGLAIAAFVVLQSALVPGSVWSPLHYELKRGFEFSSLPGSLTALVDPLHLRWVYGFGSWEVVGSGHAAIQMVVGILEGAVLVVLWTLAWRGRLLVDELSLAVLSTIILGDRALAPQYLVWVIPLWALWPIRRAWLAAAALTTLTFPFAFSIGSRFEGSLFPATLVGMGRNIVLLAGTLAWVHERLKSRIAVDIATDQSAQNRPVGGTESGRNR